MHQPPTTSGEPWCQLNSACVPQLCCCLVMLQPTPHYARCGKLYMQDHHAPDCHREPQHAHISPTMMHPSSSVNSPGGAAAGLASCPASPAQCRPRPCTTCAAAGRRTCKHMRVRTLLHLRPPAFHRHKQQPGPNPLRRSPHVVQLLAAEVPLHVIT